MDLMKVGTDSELSVGVGKFLIIFCTARIIFCLNRGARRYGATNEGYLTIMVSSHAMGRCSQIRLDSSIIELDIPIQDPSVDRPQEQPHHLL